MGMLMAGQWVDKPIAKQDKAGNFIRPDSAFRHWITKDGAGGFKAEPNRYHLYVSYACPWASRAIIFRQLKQLTDIISLSTVEPIMLKNGWEFNQHFPDAIEHKDFLYQIYQMADSNYSGKVTVPVLWDKQTKTIVNNESADIIRMLNSEFNELANETVDYYPSQLRQKIDEINEFIYHKINNGVYKCGFAKTQTAYDHACGQLFTALAEIDILLGKQRYLVGDEITEADWRLFTTLIRFDVVYVTHFKCNVKRIDDFPNLRGYVRDLYQHPGIAGTVNFEHIKTHYFASHLFINPTGIIPKGPIIDYATKHSR